MTFFRIVLITALLSIVSLPSQAGDKLMNGLEKQMLNQWLPGNGVLPPNRNGTKQVLGVNDIGTPAGSRPGDMLYWNGTAYVVLPAGAKHATLTFCYGAPTWGACPYALGEKGPAGGIVFYLDATRQHGLEAAPVDQSSGAIWGCFNNDIAGADGMAVGTGRQNTLDIIAGCADAGTAAKVAAGYSLNGYSDWFLPSRDELNLLYLQKGVGGFAGGDYWSSSEMDSYDRDSAWAQNLINGRQYGNP